MRVALFLLVASLAVAPAALASDRFTDPRGDADGPDIKAVTVSHTDDVLRIAVDFAAAPPLGHDEREQYTDMLLVGIYTDDYLQFSTGVHGVEPTRAVVARGPNWRRVGTAKVAVEGATVTLEIERALLEDPDEVGVQVAAGREFVSEQTGGGEGDFAPASTPHRYALVGDGVSAWLWPLVIAAAAAGAALTAFTLLWTGRRARGHRLHAAS